MIDKSILKNKYGWRGAVIYFLLLLITFESNSRLGEILATPVRYTFETFICRTGGLECLGGALLFGIPLIIVFGFIFGLIYQRLFVKKKRASFGRRRGRK